MTMAKPMNSGDQLKGVAGTTLEERSVPASHRQFVNGPGDKHMSDGHEDIRRVIKQRSQRR